MDFNSFCLNSINYFHSVVLVDIVSLNLIYFIVYFDKYLAFHIYDFNFDYLFKFITIDFVHFKLIDFLKCFNFSNLKFYFENHSCFIS